MSAAEVRGLKAEIAGLRVEIEGLRTELASHVKSWNSSSEASAEVYEQPCACAFAANICGSILSILQHNARKRSCFDSFPKF